MPPLDAQMDVCLQCTVRYTSACNFIDKCPLIIVLGRQLNRITLNKMIAFLIARFKYIIMEGKFITL